MKTTKIILLSMMCLSLCSCGTVLEPVYKTWDCGNLWKSNDCILFEPFKGDSERTAANKKINYSYYRSYASQKIKRPAKTWGDK